MRINRPSAAVVLSAAMALISSLRCASEKIITQPQSQAGIEAPEHNHPRHTGLSADQRVMDQTLEKMVGKENVPCCHNPFKKVVVEQGASQEVAICVPGSPLMDPEKLRQHAALKVRDIICGDRRICQVVLKSAEVTPDGKNACAVVDTTELIKSSDR